MTKNIEILIRKNKRTIFYATFRASIAQAQKSGLKELARFEDGAALVVKNNGNRVAGWLKAKDRMLPVNSEAM